MAVHSFAAPSGPPVSLTADKPETLRIEMTLDEAVSLYRLLADSDRQLDGRQLGLVRELRDFLHSRLSLREIEGEDQDGGLEGAKSLLPEIREPVSGAEPRKPTEQR